MRNWMKLQREKKHFTQMKLSEMVNVSEHYIYLIEAGVRKPSVKLAKKIAKALDLDWTQFYEDSKTAS